MSINPVDQYELAREALQQSKNLSPADFRKHMGSLGVKYRKAMYLISVLRAQKTLHYTDTEMRELMRELGWTKVAAMLPSMTRKRSVKALIRQYQPVTVHAVKKDFSSANSPSDAVFAVNMKQAQYNKLMRLLKMRGMKEGVRKIGVSGAFAQLVDSL